MVRKNFTKLFSIGIVLLILAIPAMGQLNEVSVTVSKLATIEVPFVMTGDVVELAYSRWLVGVLWFGPLIEAYSPNVPFPAGVHPIQELHGAIGLKLAVKLALAPSPLWLDLALSSRQTFGLPIEANIMEFTASPMVSIAPNKYLYGHAAFRRYFFLGGGPIPVNGLVLGIGAAVKW